MAGGISLLLELSRVGTDAQNEFAAAMLMDLSVNAANRVVIANAGGIHPLIAMAQDGNDKMKLKAVGTL